MQYGEVHDKNLFVEVYTATLKIYDRLRRARAASWTQDRGIDTSQRNYFGSKQKTTRVTWMMKGEMEENILSGKLSDPLEEAVNRYRNYRVTKSSALFIRLDNRDNSVQVQM